MARYYFGRDNAVGKYFSFDGDEQTYEIIGVAGNANYFEIREPQWRTVYLDAFQDPRPPSAFMLRARIEPEAVAPIARRTVRDVLKDIPVPRVTTLASQVDASIVPERVIAMLSGLFGWIGALLGASMRSASAWLWVLRALVCCGWCSGTHSLWCAPA